MDVPILALPESFTDGSSLPGYTAGHPAGLCGLGGSFHLSLCDPLKCRAPFEVLPECRGSSWGQALSHRRTHEMGVGWDPGGTLAVPRHRSPQGASSFLESRSGWLTVFHYFLWIFWGDRLFFLHFLESSHLLGDRPHRKRIILALKMRWRSSEGGSPARQALSLLTFMLAH